MSFAKRRPLTRTTSQTQKQKVDFTQLHIIMSEASRGRTGELLASAALPLVVTWLTKDRASSPESSHLALFLTFCLLESAWGNLFRTLVLLPAARAAARRLPGADVPDSADGMRRQEDEANDASLSWPTPGSLAGLPPEWGAGACGGGDPGGSREGPVDRKAGGGKGRPGRATAEPPLRRPYHLNHVRGSTRVRHASQRIGAALGTLLATHVLCSLSPLVSFEDIGLDLSSPRKAAADMLCGFVVGSAGVLLIFAIELRRGWIKSESALFDFRASSLVQNCPDSLHLVKLTQRMIKYMQSCPTAALRRRARCLPSTLRGTFCSMSALA